MTTGWPELYTMTCAVGGQTLSMTPCSAATPAVVHGSVKGKPHRRATCAAKARSKHGKARKRALRRCRAAAHKQAKRRHT